LISRPAAVALAALATMLAACGTGTPAPAPAAAPSGASGARAAVGADWPTYHGDAARSGVAAGTGAAFRSARAAWPDVTVDADVYASPIVAGGVVVVATENDSVYAFDAATGHPLWFRHLGSPVRSSTLPCGDIRPISGITSTPVADVAAGIVWVVAFLDPGQHVLFGLDVASGEVRGQARRVDPPEDSPLVEQQRGALALAGGLVLVPYGGLTGDCGSYHGWVVGAPAAGGQPLTYRVPCGRECGLWAPGGPTVDAAGDVWVASGNSESSDRFDYGNSVLRLSPQLQLRDYFAPADWAALNRSDQDLGSISPVVLDSGLVWISGKSGTGYLLRRDHLGEVGGQAFQARACRSYAGTAYAAPRLYLSCSGEIAAVTMHPDGPSFKVDWRRSLGAPGAPILAGGVLWAIETQTGDLVALDLGDGRERFRLPGAGPAMHFATPAASGALVFAARGRALTAVAVQTSARG
jgi:putative pyrroloquinoline-quinone binding quinoprotein